MKKLIKSASQLFFLSICLLFSLSCFAGTTTTTSLSPMLQKVLPAVVNIRAQIKITDLNTLNKLQQERKKQGQDEDQPLPDKLLSVASGVIMDANKGYILTNAHVVEDAQSVIVILGDKRHFSAKVIGIDKPSDIAVLQIQAKNLTAIPVANSNDLKVGDFVAAIGNPFGLNQTVTSGIVSALGRTTLGIENFENFIQTDASINPGNSGGALVDNNGELVGINTAILAPARGNVGIGFAIPSNMAKSVMQQLIQYGNVKRGALGIGVQDITPELADAFHLSSDKGAVVTQVMMNSPAQKAGFEIGDVITTIDGANIKNANDVVNGIAFLRVDSKASVTYLRNNKSKHVTVVISDPKKNRDESEHNDPFLYGVALKDFTLLSPIHGDIKGVLVVSVDEDSNAWHSDLQPGDVVTSANQEKVASIAELRAIADKTKQTLLLNVLRGRGAVFLVINREES